MYVLPSRNRFRRRTRLEQASVQIEHANQLIQGVINVLGVYVDPKNWQPTDETKDVKNEAGLVVGVERIHIWSGPGSGPELAGNALRRILNTPKKQ